MGSWVAIFGVLCAGLAALLGWFVLPPLDARYVAAWAVLSLAVTGAGLGVLGLLALRGRAAFAGPAGRFAVAAPLAGLGLLALVLLVAFVTSTPMLHAARYAALAGDMTPRAADAVEAVLPALSLERAPLVTAEVARRAAEARLGGEDPALGSVVEIGRLTRQLVGGRLVWVGFLEHRGFFPWLRARTTPGYVLVDAADSQDVRLVREQGGAPLALRYLASASLHENLRRHAWLAGHNRDGLGPATAQVDEAGRPYAVIPLLAKAVGMGGEVVTGVLVVDVQTGATQRYDRDQAPPWIELVEPGTLVFQRLEDWGRYHSGGWLNPSQAGRLQTSTWELDLVSAEDGRSYWVTGLTSVGRDTSLTGLVLVDTRSGVPARFPLAGVIEEQATAIVEQAYREKGYRASNPTPLLVEGVPAYVMALTDDAGSTKAFGMVAIQNKETFATATTLQGAVQLFQDRVARNRRDASAAEQAERVTLRGQVQRIGATIREGSTWFYLTVDAAPGLLLGGPAALSDELAVTAPGDSVRLEYQPLPAGATAELRSFDNEAVGAPPRSAP